VVESSGGSKNQGAEDRGAIGVRGWGAEKLLIFTLEMAYFGEHLTYFWKFCF